MPESKDDPKDVADMLEAIARKLRKGPAAPTGAPSPGGLHVAAPSGSEETAPWLGEVDLFSDATHVTVTAQTRNADAAHVHVSVADGHLLIGVGEGSLAMRKDVALPAPIDEEHAYATFRNGVLDVVLPLKGSGRRGG